MELNGGAGMRAVRILKTRASDASETRAATPVKTIVAANAAAARIRGLTKAAKSSVGIKLSTRSMHSLCDSLLKPESGSNPEQPLICP